MPFLLSSIFNRTPTTAPSSTMQGDDEEWSDVSSQGSTPPGTVEDDSRRCGGMAYTEEERALLPSMPTLFSSDLPPCGLIPQLAYENIVHHLRKVWLKRAIEHPVNNIRVFDICKEVHQDLWAEAERQPIDSQLGTKARRPWRREDVFKYEISWAAYLMKESEMLEMRPKLNEKELDRLQFLEKMFPIPKALGIEVKNNLNKTWVFDLWKAWHHKKRGTEPQDGTGLGIGGARDDDEEDAGRSEDVVSGDEGRTEGAAGTA